MKVKSHHINIQEEFIRTSLDYEEKARIDYDEDDGTTLFVIDVPVIEKELESVKRRLTNLEEK